MWFRQTKAQQGYILIATALALTAVLGATALAVDLGRMFIAKNEAQSYTDSAALRAAIRLDGTTTGFQRAREAVAADVNRWNFGYRTFASPRVEFGQTAGGPWEANPGSASNYLFVRITADAPVPMSFAQVIGQGSSRPVNAQAVAGQVQVTGRRHGLLPFSPFAHNDWESPHFGLDPGQLYTLRWAASPRLNNQNSTCPGDAVQSVIDIAQQGGGEERGYIEESSSAIIRRSIVYDYQTVFRQIGDSVTMTGGAKQTQRDALVDRIRQDSDNQSETYAEYRAHNTGNGRRVVAAPINLGAPGGYRIVQIGAFFLQTENDYLEAQGGNKPFCAEYIGPYVEGGTGSGAATAGYYVVRLVQ